MGSDVEEGAKGRELMSARRRREKIRSWPENQGVGVWGERGGEMPLCAIFEDEDSRECFKEILSVL